MLSYSDIVCSDIAISIDDKYVIGITEIDTAYIGKAYNVYDKR